MKRIIAFLIALILLVSAFSSCDRRSQTPVTEDDSDYGETMEGVLKIAYSKNDALNPYYVESEINLQVSKLVYDGLYTIDSSYKANPCLAASAIVSDNSVNVNLADSVFSDGSPVTSTDVVYSFNKAKSSEYYSSRLSNVTSRCNLF